ncbi:MAG: tRNA (N(6)-L-threonylcarbamoyladenosine(37)-C(2))-methylthiotransferase MtaB [Candidatus Subteraquimicrobiales bacterium]|nr:tRNA (N(6)-L-threonylcarbamoyladenosine(37)-C(2))-methylthiotransferase MtaB [Candidatus Subteraquimicrobiales bacterium]
MPKVAFYTLGCKVNQYETEAMIRDFLKYGFEIVNFNDSADVYVINTCTVTTASDNKSRQAIRVALNRNPSAITVASGCYVNWAKDRLSELGCHLVLTNEEKPNLTKMVISQYFPLTQQISCVPSGKQLYHTRALLKVEDGCDQFCTYCIVPYVRGKPQSRSFACVIEEASKLAEAGVKEIVLSGIRLGKYGLDLDNKKNLVYLLEELSEFKNLKRIRLSSIEVNEVTSDLIYLLKDNPKFCRHLHIPLQSGSNRILSAMNRGYTRKDYLELIENLKNSIPEIAITTDVIVGFPNESRENFLETRNLIEEVGFRKLHVFKYSPRPLTKAFDFKDNVCFAEKKERSDELILLGKSLAQDYVRKFMGRKLEVLVEKEGKEGYLTGLTDNYIRVYFKGEKSLKGRMVKVMTNQIKEDTLFGEVLS